MAHRAEQHFGQFWPFLRFKCDVSAPFFNYCKQAAILPAAHAYPVPLTCLISKTRCGRSAIATARGSATCAEEGEIATQIRCECQALWRRNVQADMHTEQDRTRMCVHTGLPLIVSVRGWDDSLVKPCCILVATTKHRNCTGHR